jgi:hypothetical protein
MAISTMADQMSMPQRGGAGEQEVYKADGDIAAADILMIDCGKPVEETGTLLPEARQLIGRLWNRRDSCHYPP